MNKFNIHSEKKNKHKHFDTILFWKQNTDRANCAITDWTMVISLALDLLVIFEEFSFKVWFRSKYSETDHDNNCLLSRQSYTRKWIFVFCAFPPWYFFFWNFRGKVIQEGRFCVLCFSSLLFLFWKKVKPGSIKDSE